MNAAYKDSTALLSKIYEKSRVEVPTEDRIRVFAALFHLALEHQFSILKLIGMQESSGRRTNLGSALRSSGYFSIPFIPGIWGYYCATPDRFQLILKDDKYAYPTFDKMSAELARTHRLGNFFLSHNHAWNALCSYTHSGMHQISRRFDSAGDLTGMGYNEDEIDDALKGTSTLIAAIATEFFRAIDEREAEKEVAEIYNRLFGTARSS